LRFGRRFLRRCHDGDDLVRLGQQRIHFRCTEQFSFNYQLKPKHSFICFFFDNPKLGNELWFRTTSARRAVISCYRRTASYQLGCYCSSLDRLRQGANKLKNPQSELLCSLEKFAFSH